MDGSVLSVSGKLHSLLNGKQNYSLPILYEINFKEMTYSFLAIYATPGGRRQAVSNRSFQVWCGRIVKVHCGTEHDEWKDDDEIETLSPPIEGRLHLEYTYRSTVWQFLQLSFKTNRPKTGWLKSHKPNIFWIAIPCCIQISLTLFWYVNQKRSYGATKTVDLWPPTERGTQEISSFDDDRPKIGRSYGRCIGIILKQIVCKIWISLTLFYSS